MGNKSIPGGVESVEGDENGVQGKIKKTVGNGEAFPLDEDGVVGMHDESLRDDFDDQRYPLGLLKLHRHVARGAPEEPGLVEEGILRVTGVAGRVAIVIPL